MKDASVHTLIAFEWVAVLPPSLMVLVLLTIVGENPVTQ